LFGEVPLREIGDVPAQLAVLDGLHFFPGIIPIDRTPGRPFREFEAVRLEEVARKQKSGVNFGAFHA
jgi:hypothetical protein